MNPIKRNLFWLLLAQAATWIVSVSLLLVAPRVLGDKTFGQLSFVIVYTSFFDLVASMGINTFLIKEIARDTTRVGRYLVNAVAIKLLLSSVLSCAAIGLGMLLSLPRTTILLIAIYCLGMVINSVGSTIGAALGGLQLMAGLSKWNIVQAYVGGLAGIAVLVTHGSVVMFALVSCLAFIVPIGPNLHRLWPYLGIDRKLDVRFWKAIVKGGFPFFVLAALLVVYGTIDVPLLQVMTGSAEVGWYALAYRWVSVPAFFAAAVSTVFFPVLSAEGVQLNPAFGSLANRAIRIAVLVATPAAIGIAMIASPFITLLYRGDFQEAIPLLQILALHIPIVSLDIILGSVAMASDRQRQWVIVSIIATLFNPLLNLVAIPASQHAFHNGAIGAAVVTVLTELILMVGGIALRPKGVLDRPTVNGLVRITLASLTIVPVVLVLGSTPLLVQVLGGVLVYAVASLALRAITVDEVRGLMGGVLSRFGRRPAADGAVELAMAPVGVGNERAGRDPHPWSPPRAEAWRPTWYDDPPNSNSNSNGAGLPVLNGHDAAPVPNGHDTAPVANGHEADVSKPPTMEPTR